MFLFLLESAARSLVLAIVVWTGLFLFRIRSPRDQFFAWAAVLLSAAFMPLLIVAVQSLMAPPSLAWIPASSPSLFLRPLPSAISNTTASSMDFVGLVSVFYAVVVGVFLVRLASGLRRSRRLVKKAISLRESWTQGRDVRVSRDLAVPATIGSTILLPSDHSQWDDFTRDAVLAHESAHVRRRDFYTHLIAGLHQAVFWFSPLSWWLRRQLMELAENASDDEAIVRVKDRTVYAGLLVDFASRAATTGFVGVEMARSGMVTVRVERMLGDITFPQKSSLLKRLLLVSVFIPILGFSAAAWSIHAAPKALASPVAVPVSTSPGWIRTVQPAPVQAPSVAVAQPQTALSPWIDKEVPDIATQQERDAFLRLGSEEERTLFIEQFWLRRDPTPSTPENEFRNEYYRRVAVANRRFTNGIAGWLTDRGRILIMRGEPDEIETHAIGGTILNPGGPPFERWRYRYLEGVGANVILEFVDRAGDGNYRLESPKELVSPALR
jgi:GWxTD domain-containing protein